MDNYKNKVRSIKFNDLSKKYELKTYKYTLNDFLIIHLNRFKYNPLKNLNEKINKEIKVEQELILSDTMKYELISVSCHEGGNSGCGHFITIIKQNNKFYKYNFTSDTGEITWDIANNHIRKDGYIFLYKKID